MNLPRPRRPHTRRMSDTTDDSDDFEGYSRQDVVDEDERGIWDEDDDLGDAGGVSSRAPWGVTIWNALWGGLQPLGAVGLYCGVAAFATEPTGEAVTAADLTRLGWQVIGIYTASVAAWILLGRWRDRLRASRADLDR